MIKNDESIQNLDRLLPEEKERLEALYKKWEAARQEKKWQEADRLRDQLMLWDSNIINDKL